MNARDKIVSKEVRCREDHVIDTACIGILLFDFAACVIHQKSVQYMAGLAAARARGRKGGRKFALTKAQVRMAQAEMASRDTSVAELCKALGVRPPTLYR